MSVDSEIVLPIKELDKRDIKPISLDDLPHHFLIKNNIFDSLGLDTEIKIDLQENQNFLYPNRIQQVELERPYYDLMDAGAAWMIEEARNLHEHIVIQDDHLTFDKFNSWMEEIEPPSSLTDLQHEVWDFLKARDLSEVIDFKNTYQLDALKIIGRKGSNVVALQFSNVWQIKALNIFVKDNPDLALKFTDGPLVHALEILGRDKYEIALQFTNIEAVEALKILGPDKFEDALKFTNNLSSFYQIMALEFLGEDKLSDAMHFINQEQIDSLEHCLNNKFSQDDCITMVIGDI